ncbi:aldehyde dehydrogenase domain-containing protein [Gorgonomyces haynaldii]|nr:aldehyde dehydrogenase domain-containing protein [Gorgonomyces haynaldii]
MALRKQEFADLETISGKPIAQSILDVEQSIDTLRYFAKQVPNGRVCEDGYTIREPMGVVGLITSFNYPLLLTTWKMAPALAAGNTCLIKPAMQTPHSALLLGHICNKIHKDAVQIVLGDASVGKALVNHPDVDMISFTGSTPAGKAIALDCARELKPCTLELGGKNAAIVFEDCDMEKTLDLVMWGAFANMGQNCCAISRLLIQDSIYDQFVERLVEKTRSMAIGDPRDPKTEIGPLVDEAQATKVQRFIDAHPQKPILGGNRSDLFIEPTIYSHVEDSCALAQDEIFGPVLAILKPYSV